MTAVGSPIVIDANSGSFTLKLYAHALANLHRYDGMFMQAHPIMAAKVRYMIVDEPMKLPIVTDARMPEDAINIIDIRSTGTVAVRIEKVY